MIDLDEITNNTIADTERFNSIRHRHQPPMDILDRMYFKWRTEVDERLWKLHNNDWYTGNGYGDIEDAELYDRLSFKYKNKSYADIHAKFMRDWRFGHIPDLTMSYINSIIFYGKNINDKAL